MKSLKAKNWTHSFAKLTLALAPAVAIAAAPLQAFGESPMTTVQSGRAPGKNMKMKASKVPQFPMVSKTTVNKNGTSKTEYSKIQAVPLLDVGQEAQLAAPSTKTLGLQIPPAPKVEVKKLKSPVTVEVTRKKVGNIQPISASKKLVSKDPNWKVPAVPQLKEVKDPELAKSELKLADYKDLTPNEYKMLQAQIFLQIQKNYNLALGLFAELILEKDFKDESQFFLAQTAQGLGLYNEYIKRMTDVANSSKKLQSPALTDLVENIQPTDTSTINLIEEKVEAAKIETKNKFNYLSALAMAEFDRGDLKGSIETIETFKENEPHFIKLNTLKAVALYKLGKVEESQKALENILLKMGKAEEHKDSRSVAAMTLARIQFQKGNYKPAYEAYLNVDKKNSLWLQSLIEQAWAQVLSQDYEGAAGNMFSLHTDFFKNAFAPESYIVRSVGYLNLCQFGDGLQVIKELNHRYTPVKQKMEGFKANSKSESAYYDVVKSWLQNPELKEVQGLPRALIIEMARHPSFTNEQEKINSSEDEINKWNEIALAQVRLERELLKKNTETNQKLTSTKAKLNSIKDEEEKNKVAEEVKFLEKRLLSYQIQYHIAKKARSGTKDVRAAALSYLETVKTEKRKTASTALKSRFEELMTGLNSTLDQTDVLAYEIFSGAGEHLRFQAAGGQITEKERQALQSPDGKSMKWGFKGEIWEDEVGYYRSSLKNVCPKGETEVTMNNK